MKMDPKDVGGKAERTGDGVTGYNVGSNPGPGWISENSGKLVILAVIFLVVGVSAFLIINS